MKLSKNKRGDSTFDDIKDVLLGLLVIGALFVLVVLVRKAYILGTSTTNQFAPPAGINYSNDFLFTAENISIPDGNNCVWTNGEYDCKTGNDVNFETGIRNDGFMMRRFYGGIIVCRTTCNNRGSCTIDDKSCYDDVISSSGTCSVKIGETITCDAGSYRFGKGTYMVFPVATCFLDNTYGCSKVGMTSAPQSVNIKRPVKVVVIS